MFKFVSQVYKIVFGVFIEYGKIKNFFFNVDVYFGVFFQYYGLIEVNYYIVFFGVFCVIGVFFQFIFDCVFGVLIECFKFFFIEKWIEIVKKL